MSENWRGAIQIAYEIALLNWPILAVYLAIWLSFWVTALHKGLPRRILPLKSMLAIWLISTVLAMAAIPYLTHATLSDIANRTDWLILAIIAAGAGMAILLLAWPLLLACKRKSG